MSVVGSIGIPGLSGNRDTDRQLLLTLSDKDLLSACSTNKYLFTSVCDDKFFYSRLFSNYPDTLKYFDVTKDKNYKRYYLKVIYYVSKLKEFNYSYVDGNPEKQYHIFLRPGAFVEDILARAAEEGEIEIVKEALKRGVDIHRYQEQALGEASKKGNLEMVKYLISQGARIGGDERALEDAAKHGQLEVIKYLVSIGANIHVNNEHILRVASERGHLEVVKYLVEYTPPISSRAGNLIKNGADFHANNEMALKKASEFGHLEIVKYLVGLGVNISVASALGSASFGGHLNVVKYLLESGADIHEHNDEALILASWRGHLEVVKYLVQKGANVNAQNGKAIKNALNDGHVEIAKYLSKYVKKMKK